MLRAWRASARRRMADERGRSRTIPNAQTINPLEEPLRVQELKCLHCQQCNSACSESARKHWASCRFSPDTPWREPRLAASHDACNTKTSRYLDGFAYIDKYVLRFDESLVQVRRGWRVKVCHLYGSCFFVLALRLGVIGQSAGSPLGRIFRGDIFADCTALE